MRRFLFVLVVFLLLGPGDAPRGSAQNEALYFYMAGQRWPVQESMRWLVVRLKDTVPLEQAPALAQASPLLAPAQEWKSFPVHHAVALRLEPPADGPTRQQLRQLLLQDPRVEAVWPAYEYGNWPHFLNEEVIAQFPPGWGPQRIEQVAAQFGLTVKEPLGHFAPNVFLLRLRNLKDNALEAANRLFESGQVLYAYPNFIREMQKRLTPNDPLFDQQWYLNSTGQLGDQPDADIDAPEAWDLSIGDRGITIAIIDDGVDIGHEDFQALGKIAPGFDVIRDIPNPRPLGNDAHGTAVAGIATAVINNNRGIAGVAPDCRLMGIRLVATGATIADEAQAFQWATDNGADVINNSWGPPDGLGIPQPLPDSTRQAIDYAADQGRQGRGCVIVFSAGNGDESMDLDGYASYDKVIAVGASTDQDRRAPYSDYGQTLDLCAPSNGGVNAIVTTDITGPRGYDPGNYVSDFGGTSASAPQVSGVAALMLSVNPLLTRQDVQNILQNTADKIDPSGGFYDPSGHSVYYGYGKVNAFAAVQAASLFRDIKIVINNDALRTTSANVTLTLTSQAATEYRLGNSVQALQISPFQSPFQTSVPWTLAQPNVEGVKTVYFQARTQLPSGAWLYSPIVSDDIYLDLPPKLLRATSIDDGHVVLFFDQDMDPTNAANPSFYAFTPPVSVNRAQLDSADSKVIHVFTASQQLGVRYTVTVTGATDRLVLTDPQGQQFVFNTPVDPNFNRATYRCKWIALETGWPQFADSVVLASPIAFSHAGEGFLVLVSAGGKVMVWRWAGSTVLPAPGWPQSAGSGVVGGPAAGDISGDGQPDIVVAGVDGRVYAWDLQGRPLAGWPRTIPEKCIVPPTLADIDGDGGLEVLVPLVNGQIFAWNGNGSLVQGWPVDVGAPVTCPLAVADMDLDASAPPEKRMEVVVADQSGRVHVFHGDGSPANGWPRPTGAPFEGVQPTLVNWDVDPQLEVLIGNRGGRLFAFNHDGTPVPGWPVSLTGVGTFSTVAVADLNGDGRPEAVVGTNTNEVYALGNNGAVLPGWPKTLTGASPLASPLVAEMQWDAGPEVIVGTSDGYIYAWNARTLNEVYGWGRTAQSDNWVLKMNAPGQPRLLLADVDGADGGRLELVAISETEIRVYDIGPGTYNPIQPFWPMWGENPRRTGLKGDTPLPMDVVPPRLRRAVPVHSNLVRLEFSEPLRADTATVQGNYSIRAGTTTLTVQGVRLSPDGHEVELDTATQSRGVEYTVVVMNVRDIAGNLIGAQNTALFTGVDTLPPEVVQVRALGSRLVEVLFNEELDKASAENPGHYQISPSLAVERAELQADGKTVRLTTGLQEGERLYTLFIFNIQDISGNRMTQVVSQTFVGVESVPPQVVSATPIRILGQGTVDVRFSEPVERSTAETVANYTLAPALPVRRAELRADGQTVRLVTDPQERGTVYVLTVQNVRDLNGNVISGNNQALFTGLDTIAPTLVSATPLDNQRVRVVFNERLNRASAQSPANYRIFLAGDPSQGLAVTGASLEADGKSVVLTTAPQREGADYVLQVSGVEDESGNAVVAGQGDTVGFTALSGAPIVLAVRALSESEVEVEFNEEVDSTTAEDPANYRIVRRDDPGRSLAVLRATLQPGGTKVLLRTDRQEEGAAYLLTVSGVQDRSGIPVAPGAGGEFLSFSQPPRVAQVEFVDFEHVRLTFTETVDEGSAEGPSNYLFTPSVEVVRVELLADGRTVNITTRPLAEATTYTVRVRNVLDLANIPVQSGVGDTATFATPAVPPRLLGVERIDNLRLRLLFSEPLEEASVLNKGNYVFSPGLQVQQVRLEAGGTSVLLITEAQREDTTYSVTVTGVRDLAGVTIGPENAATFITPRVLPQPPTGIAILPVVGGLQLTWSPSPDSDVIGYHVYRASTLTGPYTAITRDPVVGTSFVDPTVVPGVVYYYRLTALDNGPAPNEGEPSPPISALLPDREAPTIEHQPAAGLEAGRDAVVEARVKDNGQLEAVSLLYRPIGAPAWKEGAMTLSGEDLYSFRVAASEIGGQGLEYRLRARDRSGNETWAPSATTAFQVPLYAAIAGSVLNLQGQGMGGATVQLRQQQRVIASQVTSSDGAFRFERVVPGAYTLVATGVQALPAFQSFTLQSGEQKTLELRLISQPPLPGPRHLLAFPVLFADPTPASIFGDPQVQVGTFDTASNRYLFTPTVLLSVQRGRGYWLLGTGPFTIRQEASLPPQTEALSLPLSAGWNLLGNPFVQPLRLSDLKVRLPGQSEGQALSFHEAAQQGWVDSVLWAFDPQRGYVPILQFEPLGLLGVVEPWQGFWLRARRDVILTFLPPGAWPREAARRRVDGSKVWRIPLEVQVGPWVDALNWAGWLEGSSDGLRLAEPPQPTPFVSLSFLGSQGERWAFDLRSVRTPRMTWDILVETDVPNEEVILTASDLSSVPADAGIFLEDVETGLRQYLRTHPVYTFRSGPEGARRRLRLIVEQNGRRRLAIQNLRVEPGRGGLRLIAFELPQEAKVTVEVLSLGGQVLSRLAEGRSLAAGRQSLLWDGRDAQGRPLPPGVYLLRLEARGEMGEAVQAVRLLQP